MTIESRKSASYYEVENAAREAIQEDTADAFDEFEKTYGNSVHVVLDRPFAGGLWRADLEAYGFCAAKRFRDRFQGKSR